jgi:hypothetical protein
MSTNPVQQKRALRTAMEAAQKQYNNNLKTLIQIARAKSPSDDNLAKINEALRGVLAVDQTTLIIETGKYVWEYRDPISKRDEKFFLEGDFKKRIEDGIADITGRTKSGKKADFTGDDIDTIMNSLRKTYRGMTQPEQTVVWQHTSQLLASYAQYLKAEKQIIKIEQEINAL